MFKHQISITSHSGVGSSSLLKALKIKLADTHYRWSSGGELFRKRGYELGMTVEEFAEYNRLHPEEGHDKWIDDTTIKMAEEDWLVYESRLSHFFMPYAFKVLLECSIDTRVGRRQKDFPHMTHAKVKKLIEERDKNDNVRYEKLYPGCIWKKDKYDLVLSTEIMSPQELADLLINEYKKWQENAS